MILLAHFTPTEIPGTLAVLLLGVCLGGLLFSRELRSPLSLIVATSLAVFAVLGYTGDVRDWPESTRVVIDGIFLAHAAFLAVLTVRRSREAPRR